MKGAGVQKRSLTERCAGCKGYLHFCCGRVLFNDEEGYKQGDLLCPSVTVELTQHYCTCLSPSIMRIAVKREGVKQPVMSVIQINVAVALGRMHQTVVTTVCTA
jgi:hypothetical protein